MNSALEPEVKPKNLGSLEEYSTPALAGEELGWG
jgi:hypothetical protein